MIDPCRVPSPIYKRRDPQHTVLYQVVQNTLEEWLGNYSLRHGKILPDFVEKEFIAYFKCGILAHGFARAYCAHCGADFIVAYSCKKRGVCPSCTTKHMISITTHLLENVLPKLPIRQWVLSVPKWLRAYIKKDSRLASQVLPLAPNSPYRSQVIKFANALYRPEEAINNTLNESLNVPSKDVIFIYMPKKCSQSWSKLIAQVYEVDLLRCEQCGETMKLIAFIKDTISIKRILSYLGEECEAPKPPLCPHLTTSQNYTILAVTE